ncbi:MAG: hypothetical protein EBT66_01195 [Bacteroidetes bacterium]|nr:hypothetical protein [Bacteroidota bacterium]
MIPLLTALPQWLQKITFTNTELVAAILSFWCVWLAAKNSILNWPVAMAGSVLYVVVFYQSALYSDAFLNVIFLGFQAFGWYKWSRSGSQNKTLKATEKLSTETLNQPLVAETKQWLPVLVIGLILYIPWTFFVKSIVYARKTLDSALVPMDFGRFDLCTDVHLKQQLRHGPVVRGVYSLGVEGIPTLEG